MATLEVPGLTDRLNTLFKEQEMNQTEFCKKHDFKQPQFSEWLSGTIPEFPTLRRLALAFGVPWQWLVIGDDGYDIITEWRKRRR